ncbi:hypothetical protein [Tissierella praeacuta]|uniref:hypothetical protein n=1 Tax=Tissierella praeacuta TaxID=43131 RepID=UPI00333E3195
MKCRYFYYTICDFEKNEVFSCGATFLDFMEFIKIRPNNILLLKASFGDGKYNRNIGFDYVDSENMEELINDDVYSYGDFIWVDYDDVNIINNMSSLELAELLYIGYTFKPLDEPFMNWLNNKYIYLAHDDDYWTKIYMENIKDYKSVMHGKILDALKGRKKHIEPLPDDIIDYIFKHSQYGILFDFENITFYNGKTGVKISKLGKNYNYDKIFDVFKRKEYFTNISIYLEYNSRNKKWSMSREWK